MIDPRTGSLKTRPRPRGRLDRPGELLVVSARAGSAMLPIHIPQVAPWDEVDRGNRMSDASIPDLSVIIPVYNEETCIGTLATEISTVMAQSGLRWECWWVDDGSQDGSWKLLSSLPVPHRCLQLRRNCGQSAAIMAGAHHAKGQWIGILDGDGQNDPADLVRQLQVARTTESDLVVGYRSTRQDNCVRRISSRIGNWTRAQIVGRTGRDAGCSTKIIRREVLLSLPFFHGMICFVPDFVRAGGWTFQEIAVNHRPRTSGKAKYGINNRLWSGMRDLLGVRWLLSRQRADRLSEGRTLNQE